jgi:hypothetical protein
MAIERPLKRNSTLLGSKHSSERPSLATSQTDLYQNEQQRGMSYTDCILLCLHADGSALVVIILSQEGGVVVTNRVNNSTHGRMGTYQRIAHAGDITRSRDGTEEYKDREV